MIDFQTNSQTVNYFLFSLFLLIALLELSEPLHAHFLLDAKARVFHIEQADDGVHVFLRLPAPFVYADALAKRVHPQDPVQAPFLTAKWVNGSLFQVLNQADVARSPDTFAQFVANGYRFTMNNVETTPQPLHVSLYQKDERPHVTDLPGAKDAARQDKIDLGTTYYVADTIVDIEFLFRGVPQDRIIHITSSLPPIPLPPEVTIENLFIDHRFDQARTITVNGQLQQPVRLDGSWFNALRYSIWQGIVHIFTGADHILFVLCLVLAAGAISRLLWSVTGFTIGHSVTLAAGSLGYVPQGAWFVPTVELVIALSVFYAAWLVFRARSTLLTFWMAAGVGLIHGFGFSFMLGDLLGSNSQFLTTLFSFNLGVELGQFMIVALVMLLMGGLNRMGKVWLSRTSLALAMSAMAISVYWASLRTLALITAITN